MTTERVAFDCGDYRRFTGWIHFGETEGWAENASFHLLIHEGSVHAHNIVWRHGTWRSGTLTFCNWLNGTFQEGRLMFSHWEKGDFNGGLFHEGYWMNGSFNNGEFYVSRWYKGHFFNGVFRNSEWLGGKWHGGKWDLSSFRTTARFYTVSENEWLEAGRKQGYIVDEDDD